MSSATNVNIYLNNHYQGMTPEKLTEMLFKGALKNLNLAKEGVKENSPKKRGEHLSKAIAIISELYSSLDPEMTDESTQFLRGLYSTMLVELPKVSINNDVKILDIAYSYLEKLSQIWECEVMKKNHRKQSAKPEYPENSINKNNDCKGETESHHHADNNTNIVYAPYRGMRRSRLKAQSIFA